MAELEAKGPQPDQSWRHALPLQPITLGRKEGKSVWTAPWDRMISGLHATLTWQNDRLHVKRDPLAKNKIKFQGQDCDEFTVVPGEWFTIGETTFTLFQEPSALPAFNTEMTCSPQDLLQVPFLEAEKRIEVLASLPEVIRRSASESASEVELEERVLDVLLGGIARADAAALVRVDRGASSDEPRIEVHRLRVRSGHAEGFQPSRQLIYAAVLRQRQGVFHSQAETASHFTLDPEYDWALCMPLAQDGFSDWGLYVSGHSRDATALLNPAGSQNVYKSDLRFTELVAQIFGGLRQVLELQRRQALLSRFFSQAVLAAMAGQNMEEVLRPRETEVTVLFCDLRGSCRIAEEGQGELGKLWERVNEALNVMASRIIDQGGVIGDFQGDAAMGFWGWPQAYDDVAEPAERAARAALSIQRCFAAEARRPGRPLAGFACGIGIATGQAVVGKLGTLDQFKIGAFGPTVNLAARLESMTKTFRVPILIDARTTELLSHGSKINWWRCRRLAQIQPYGMTTHLGISELLPPPGEPLALTEPCRKDYEAALDAFQDGRWTDAQRLLDHLPQDGPSEYLRKFMYRHRQTPPNDWDGIMVMDAK